MPVVLKQENYGGWVDPKTSATAAKEIISDALADFVAYPVSTKVNNTRNDFQELLEPLNTSPFATREQVFP